MSDPSPKVAFGALAVNFRLTRSGMPIRGPDRTGLVLTCCRARPFDAGRPHQPPTGRGPRRDPPTLLSTACGPHRPCSCPPRRHEAGTVRITLGACRQAAGSWCRSRCSGYLTPLRCAGRCRWARPESARLASMKATISCVGGRAPPRRNWPLFSESVGALEFSGSPAQARGP